jgi:hypothetical protein
MNEQNNTESDKHQDSDSQVNVGLNDLLNSRCATCKHWDGNRAYVVEKLMDAIKDNRLHQFLSVKNTWVASGYCHELSIHACNDPEPEGVFGCILYESI